MKIKRQLQNKNLNEVILRERTNLVGHKQLIKQKWTIKNWEMKRGLASDNYASVLPEMLEAIAETSRFVYRKTEDASKQRAVEQINGCESETATFTLP